MEEQIKQLQEHVETLAKTVMKLAERIHILEDAILPDDEQEIPF